MVLFVDLDGECRDDDLYSLHSVIYPHKAHLNHGSDLEKTSVQYRRLRLDQPSGGRLAASLACYPVAECLAGQLDLTDLFSLSLTCHGIHSNLNQYAHQLKMHSLKCCHDTPPPPAHIANHVVDRDVLEDNVGVSQSHQHSGVSTPTLHPTQGPAAGVFHSALGLSGKFAQCARDLVAPCRNCGMVVCRNCAAKPPSDKCLPDRVRRMCSRCTEAPLADHLQPLHKSAEWHESPPVSSASSTASARSSSTSSGDNEMSENETSPDESNAMIAAFLRDPCTCATRGVYLCQPCGHNLRAADTTYKRVWTWRSRYSTHIGGGLGTGLGLGHHGQKCGRGEYCLDTSPESVSWVEVECSETWLQDYGREGSGGGRNAGPISWDNEGNQDKPGYFRQEIEGIGNGVMKKKVKKRVKVGLNCEEHAEERMTGRYLEREASGQQRSWCGWCSRVCPGDVDTGKMTVISGATDG